MGTEEQLILPFGFPLEGVLAAPSLSEYPEPDPVNNPSHYTMGGIEPYDFIRSWDMDFAAANVIKYVTRAPYKGKEVQDLEKARWYLNKLIEEARERT